MTPLRAWRLNYRAVFGALSEETARAWEDFARAAIKPHPSTSEFDCAMVNLCDSKHTEGGKATVIAFVSWIRRNRANSGRRNQAEAEQAKASAIRTIRYGSLGQVWAALCNPKLTDLDRPKLKHLAESTRPDLCNANGMLDRQAEFTISLAEILKASGLELPASNRKRQVAA
jgi:hypothetical protein